MRSRKHTYIYLCLAAVLALVSFLAGAVSLKANGNGTKRGINFASNFFSTDSPCPFGEVLSSEIVTPVPAVIDPFEQDLIPVFCSIQVRKHGNPVANAKGNYTNELIVLDNNTGEVERFPLGGGKFKTNSNGTANLDFEIPAPMFADGFESGDVSAWSYTRVDPTKKKRVTNVDNNCSVGSGTSS